MEVGVEFNSLSKTYNLTGARLSFLLGNREIVRRFRACARRSTMACSRWRSARRSRRSQARSRAWPEQRLLYQQRRDALCGGLRSIGWDVPDAKGTMFVWAKLPRAWEDDEAFVVELFGRTGFVHARRALPRWGGGMVPLCAGAACAGHRPGGRAHRQSGLI